MARHVYPRPSFIKSVQSGYTSLGSAETKDVSINAVNVNSSFLVFAGRDTEYCKVSLYDSDTVRASNSGTMVCKISWFLVEFFEAPLIPSGMNGLFPEGMIPSGVKTIQNVSLTIPEGSYTATATINPVNTSKTIICWLGDSSMRQLCFTLTDSTTITGEKRTATTTTVGECSVIEFY